MEDRTESSSISQGDGEGDLQLRSNTEASADAAYEIDETFTDLETENPESGSTQQAGLNTDASPDATQEGKEKCTNQETENPESGLTKQAGLNTDVSADATQEKIEKCTDLEPENIESCLAKQAGLNTEASAGTTQKKIKKCTNQETENPASGLTKQAGLNTDASADAAYEIDETFKDLETENPESALTKQTGIDTNASADTTQERKEKYTDLETENPESGLNKQAELNTNASAGTTQEEKEQYTALEPENIESGLTKQAGLNTDASADTTQEKIEKYTESDSTKQVNNLIPVWDENFEANRYYNFDHKNNSFEKEFVILLLGGQGSGKTTLVNFVANFYNGCKSVHSLKLPFSNTEGNDLKMYTFKTENEGFIVTVIDTPGLNDGLEKDKITLNLIKKFILKCQKNNLQIHAIGLTAPSHIVRLDSSEKYVLDLIKSILTDEDILNNLFLFITFADCAKLPPIVNAIEHHGVSCKNFFKFNNSVLTGTVEELEEIDEIYWKTNISSWGKIIKMIETRTSINFKSLDQNNKICLDKKENYFDRPLFDTNKDNNLIHKPMENQNLENDNVAPPITTPEGEILDGSYWYERMWNWFTNRWNPCGQ